MDSSRPFATEGNRAVWRSLSDSIGLAEHEGLPAEVDSHFSRTEKSHPRSCFPGHVGNFPDIDLHLACHGLLVDGVEGLSDVELGQEHGLGNRSRKTSHFSISSVELVVRLR